MQIWNASSGFCSATFTAHTDAVTALQFVGNNNSLVSASLDGTVRAWDTLRYRNFRTFTTPSSRQFVSLAVDLSGDVICAGTLDFFEVLILVVQQFCKSSESFVFSVCVDFFCFCGIDGRFLYGQ